MHRPDEASPPPLAEGVDYTVDESGRWVFTERHLKSRGYCCFNACRECPWGQSGKTQAQAFADLQQRLDALERRLGEMALDVKVTGYRLGVLSVRRPRSASVTGLARLGRRIQELAKPRLTVTCVAWE
jgi:uncharacterized protein DUF5522